MSSWRSGRGLQCKPVNLWWTPCPRGLRQCWKIMVATQNIDTLGPIWTFSLRGVLTFVASILDINGCVELFWGDSKFTLIQAVHSLLYIVAKCHFFSVVTWKEIIKYLQKCEGCTHLCEILYMKTSKRFIIPDSDVFYLHQIPISSHWIQTQYINSSVCLRATEWLLTLTQSSRILIIQTDLIIGIRCCVERECVWTLLLGAAVEWRWCVYFSVI